MNKEWDVIIFVVVNISCLRTIDMQYECSDIYTDVLYVHYQSILLFIEIEKIMLRWFGHVERMSESRPTKRIYTADVSGNAGRGRPRRT